MRRRRPPLVLFFVILVFFGLPTLPCLRQCRARGDEPTRSAAPGAIAGADSVAQSPEVSRRAIRVIPGFTVETVAQEPLVKDPIAFDWSADGRLWVVEMGDYPRGMDGKGKHGGVVRILQDRNGDGHYDTAQTFLEGLGFPTGLIAWRNGVIVACAPDIFYAEDRDGDGKADHREVLFTGFGEGNQQHRVNGFDFGLDGWIYGANGDSGGVIRALKTGAKVNINGRDFRFRPDDGQFEAESGGTQFGRHRDDWGHWFGNNNPNWGWHYVLADSDIRRNPRYAPPNPRQTLEPDRRVFPASQTLPRFNDVGDSNRVTSANSPTPYRDDLFGPSFATSLFVSEPVHNLIHRIVLEPDGATFRGHRASGEADREFVASSDHWTRPTMLRTGPDGALWFADMYRAVIEHPQWIPDDWEAKLDLRAGSEEGRIYRVYPSDKSPRPIPRLDRLDTAGLVAALDSPNGWQRDTAQRLLLHKADKTAVEPLRKLAAASSRPKTRLQALWTLAGLDALTPEFAIAAFSDPDAQVRRNAIKASESLLGSSPKLGEALIRRVDDRDAEVRFQTALSLGNWNDPRAGRSLATLVRRAPDDAWLRAAVLSSAAPHVATILSALFADSKDGPPPTAILGPLFAMAGAAKDRGGWPALIEGLAAPAGPGGAYAAWQFSALAGLLDAADRVRSPISPADRARLVPLGKAARDAARNPKANEDELLAAVRLLGRAGSDRDEDRDLLARLLRPQVSAAVQQAAVSALGRVDDPKVPMTLLAGWKAESPQLRTAILDVLLSRPSWTGELLSSLEDRCTPPGEIDPAHRRRLLDHANADYQKRAEAVFNQTSSSRQEALAAYKPALKLAGDRKAGAAVFKRVCATCHRLGGEGTEVGADLAALSDKSPESLLVALLDPNKAFEVKFTNFTVQTVDGRVLTGMIASETATSVTLRRQEGKEDVLLRADIDAIAASGQSLMPEGLEKDLKLQDVADVIAFLGANGPAPKSIAGNQPRRIKPDPDGTIVLTAKDAELYGDLITFESAHNNLGYWSEPNDRAVWRFDGARPGRYTLWIEWACDDAAAGNRFILELGPTRLDHKVAATGGWDAYRTEKIAEVIVAPGVDQLQIRPRARPRGALIDLRRVELRPFSPEAKAAAPGGQP